MPTYKGVIPNTLAILRHHNYGYEIQNWLRPENQAFVFDFEHHFKTTSILSSRIKAFFTKKTTNFY